jgi:hypothetical protein
MCGAMCVLHTSRPSAHAQVVYIFNLYYQKYSMSLEHLISSFILLSIFPIIMKN